MTKKTLGIIGPGYHFEKNIISVLLKNNSFKIAGVLRNKKKNIKFIKILMKINFLKKGLILYT